MIVLRSIAPAARLALASFVVTVAALGGMQLSAQIIGGHDSKAPVNYAADRIELQDRQDRVVLSGNVDITQGDLRLQAARTTVAYSDAGSLRIQQIMATGGVLVNRGSETARGNVAIYDFNKRLITMAGDVSLKRGGDTLNGQRLVINLDSGISSVDGRAGGVSTGGRVSGTFTVPQN
ncbi:MAG: LptA/OstA family protein [Caenibius sp.]